MTENPSDGAVTVPTPATPVTPAAYPTPVGDGHPAVRTATGDEAALTGADDTPPPDSLWARMKADPQYAPEHLALEAVRRLGPEAGRWAERTRATHPGIHPDALAHLAVKRFVNQARLSGAVSGAAGLAGAVLDVGVLAWTQARMVLHIAAAYGVDPTHVDRATDLLVLQRVHQVAQTARVALAVAAGRERAAALLRQGETPVGKVLLRLGVRLARMAGLRAVKRIFAKIVPGAAVILGTWANSAATTDLARRAQAHYRSAAGHALPGQRQP